MLAGLALAGLMPAVAGKAVQAQSVAGLPVAGRQAPAAVLGLRWSAGPVARQARWPALTRSVVRTQLARSAESVARQPGRELTGLERSARVAPGRGGGKP